MTIKPTMSYTVEIEKYVTKEAWSYASNKQKEALNLICQKWSKIWTPFEKMICDDCLIGQVGSEESPMIWLGIEQDGYVHS